MHHLVKGMIALAAAVAVSKKLDDEGDNIREVFNKKSGKRTYHIIERIPPFLIGVFIGEVICYLLELG